MGKKKQQEQLSDNNNTDNQDLSIAEIEQKLGNAYKKLNQYNNALKCYKSVLYVYKKYYGKNNSKSAKVMHDIGIIYRDYYVINNDHNEDDNIDDYINLSKRFLVDALNIRKFVFLVNDADGDHEDIAETLNELGVLYYIESFFISS